MKQVKYFDVYSKGKITKYCVDDTEQYRKMIKLLKHSDKDAIITYIEFDDGTNGITNEWYDLAKIKIDNVTMDILSMGMTNDYEVAIEEGATMVRVGTGIFGARNYNI